MNMTCDPNAPALSAQNIRKTFGTVTAVDGLSFTVNRGEIVALLGPNGAGKTTFIDIALGLQEADSGSVQLFGGTPREAIRRSLVGVVQQTGALDTSATVDSLLRLTASLHANPAPLDEVIEQAHLADLRRTRISKLSGGEQQRVRLALALIADPQLLFLDEPTTGMDVNARAHFWEVMRAQADRGRTVIFATHYLTEAQEFAQRIAIVKNGRLIVDAPTEEIGQMGEGATLTVLHEANVADAEKLASAVRERGESVGNSGVNGSSRGWTVSVDGSTLIVRGHDLDDAARFLLSQPGVHGLTLTPASLDDVFASLTA